MKKIHVMNIGYPRSATTWCWQCLLRQEWFNAPREKENNDLAIGTPISDYKNVYADYDITANFFAGMVHIDQYLIKQLSEIPSVQISIILRNNFDQFYSLYNFSLLDPTTDASAYTYNQWTKNLIEQGWYHPVAHLIKRWQKYFSPDRFHVFYYDQIQKDGAKFFKDYCQQMQLPTPTNVENQIVNGARYIADGPTLDQNLVKIINQEIENLEILLGQDLSRWKK